MDVSEKGDEGFGVMGVGKGYASWIIGTGYVFYEAT